MIKRFRLTGNVVRINSRDHVKRLFSCSRDGKRKVARQRLRWRNGIQLEWAGNRNWKISAVDRTIGYVSFSRPEADKSDLTPPTTTMMMMTVVTMVVVVMVIMMTAH